MDWPDYLRDQAAKYRLLAEQTDDPAIKNEMLELAIPMIGMFHILNQRPRSRMPQTPPDA